MAFAAYHGYSPLNGQEYCIRPVSLTFRRSRSLTPEKSRIQEFRSVATESIRIDSIRHLRHPRRPHFESIRPDDRKLGIRRFFRSAACRKMTPSQASPFRVVSKYAAENRTPPGIRRNIDNQIIIDPDLAGKRIRDPSEPTP